ncbi:hypothetical protein ABID82_000790 [Methylobacterium sp. PvP062]|jgi:hypothetical protein|uniref:Uncharacterized protein n=2 Tax=Methylobacterium radiotolerans TaxID=31998 RepID=B1M1G3_METRJ|nr:MULTISPECIES: hypothetical protein [Methylobacterium]ACB26138.1 hypothetical protein Mrad2831_4169 [Methylobacterium radiotolerans JCM 2831]MBE7197195.1 hypothetical protein [Parafilimonas terrae]MBY0254938.1 hypothetical protein [Methylobacterium organophilum]MCX7333756.1 hypothetical protein [Hyphomicrobiales bacterium]MBP2497273.1 hypothetical protein [Methylobacterium sp. PvP105]
MSKRPLRTFRALLWIAALMLCCFSAAMLAEANRPNTEGDQRLAGDPAVTGSVARMRWCGAAPWCR